MSSWKGKSKGTPLGYKIFIRLIQIFGVSTAYFFLRFVTLYYYLFSWETKKHLKTFYSKVPTLKKSKINKTIRKNFNYIGEAIVDKFAFLIGKQNKITYTNEGEERLKEFAEKNQALILISAHLGNWEIAGNFLKKVDAQVNVVMFDGEREKIKKLIQDEVGKVHFNIIPIKEDLSHIFKINAAVKRGEIICIHGDRFLEGAKTIEAKLFGRTVELPYGPFQIASRLKAHYSFIFTIKNAKFNYHFTSTIPAINKSADEIAQEYVDQLEKKITENPEQWFNYHPFFKEDADREKRH